MTDRAAFTVAVVLALGQVALAPLVPAARLPVTVSAVIGIGLSIPAWADPDDGGGAWWLSSWWLAPLLVLAWPVSLLRGRAE